MLTSMQSDTGRSDSRCPVSGIRSEFPSKAAISRAIPTTPRRSARFAQVYRSKITSPWTSDRAAPMGASSESVKTASWSSLIPSSFSLSIIPADSTPLMGRAFNAAFWPVFPSTKSAPSRANATLCPTKIVGSPQITSFDSLSVILIVATCKRSAFGCLAMAAISATVIRAGSQSSPITSNSSTSAIELVILLANSSGR